MLIPPLSGVLVRRVEIVPTETFQDTLLITARAFAAGVAIAVDVPVDISMGRSQLVDRIRLPWVNLFVSAPLSTPVPVTMVLFGFGEPTVVVTVVLFAIWIIVLGARAGTWADFPIAAFACLWRVLGALASYAFWAIIDPIHPGSSRQAPK
jgi:NitT/TauT family transport system permease protein